MLSKSIALFRTSNIRTSSTILKSTLLCTRAYSSGLKNNTPSATNLPADHKLTWQQFFQLRKNQRRINVTSSIFTAFIGSNISWAYLSTMQIDPTQALFGFDPLVVVSAGLITSGFIGYLFGPLFGSQVFKVMNRNKLPDFNNKNKDFLLHVIKNRVDASSQSFSNPVPDYYGERIGSLKDYKQWLRDCNAYRRKSKEFL